MANVSCSFLVRSSTVGHGEARLQFERLQPDQRKLAASVEAAFPWKSVRAEEPYPHHALPRPTPSTKRGEVDGWAGLGAPGATGRAGLTG